MSIRYERDGQAGYLLIDRPDRRNALSLEMWQAIPDLLDQAAQEAGLRVLVVKASGGGSFCAGADIREMVDHKDDPAWLTANQDAIFAAQHRLTRFPVPTLAFIEGDCIGGGCGLALACDIRVAAPTARFGITPAKLGLVYPFHDIKLLVDLVGPGQAKRLLYTGDLIDAAEAHRIGLAEILADDDDSLRSAIAAASAASNTEMKQFVRQVLDGQTDDDAETKAIFAAAFTGAAFAEGTSAFIEKRKPHFKD